ncbi:MAG: flagellar type III secretion system pore protein FliP [Deltaproteobacteria bacterium]|nr:flagellar type III secretion system pore protein FliP [Deltaproteobacteria bacterium]MBN2673067.1 flagellar type III secretion system pore protein FliP [Deltaproteobacteria bacterium]
MKRRLTILAVLVAVVLLPVQALAVPSIDISIGDTEGPGELVAGLKILALLTVLALAPAILMTLTSFTRIVIVLSFLRTAIGTQNVPPNQVLIGLAMFLTFFIMAPVGERINEEALVPYRAEQINDEEAFELAKGPIREFMLKHTREKDLMLFYEVANLPLPKTEEEVMFRALIPAFVISELKTAFEMGFMLFIPFIVLDIAIASMLMSMGMIMLPPALISLPLKLMLFVVVDGWNLIITSIVKSFVGDG